MNSDPVVIVSALRTPMGNFQGELSSLASPLLGSHAIRAALVAGKLNPEQVDEVYMGCVLPAGLGQAPARQASIGAGIPDSVPCTTVNKMCGSGMKAIMLAHDALLAGSGAVIVAGGMESMSNAPYLLDKARGGYRLGHGKVVDHMFLDGLEDAYDRGKLMGVFAEDTAQHYQFTRVQQDEFALTSLTRAQKADFSAEIVPILLKDKKGEITIAADESPRTAKPDKIPTLKPAFREGGTVTAANSSSISDGAAAVVMMRRSMADKLGCPVLATIKAHTSHAQQPAWFTTAPVGAIKKAFDKTGWSAGDVDLYEINEAFAVVAMAAMREHNLPHEKVNVHGGACALGHPIGASGARIVATLINALRQRGGKKGIASLCIGGGEATALAIEI